MYQEIDNNLYYLHLAAKFLPIFSLMHNKYIARCHRSYEAMISIIFVLLINMYKLYTA